MPTICETVKLKPNDQRVQLCIAVGSGQIGGYSVLLESRELQASEEGPSLAVYELGLGEELQFTVLIGTVKVQDVNPTSDQTTVTVTIRQGKNERIFKDHEDATTGGIVNYGLALSFV